MAHRAAWVQSDESEAERCRLARDQHPDATDQASLPADGSSSEHAQWMAEEIPFNTAQRTWERADVIVCGTPLPRPGDTGPGKRDEKGGAADAGVR